MLISDRQSEERVGKDMEVVVEGWDKWAECYFGRSYAEAPEIDGKIFFTSDSPRTVGEYVKVHIDGTMDYDLLGSVVNESAE